MEPSREGSSSEMAAAARLGARGSLASTTLRVKARHSVSLSVVCQTPAGTKTTSPARCRVHVRPLSVRSRGGCRRRCSHSRHHAAAGGASHWGKRRTPDGKRERKRGKSSRARAGVPYSARAGRAIDAGREVVFGARLEEAPQLAAVEQYVPGGGRERIVVPADARQRRTADLSRVASVRRRVPT